MPASWKILARTAKRLVDQRGGVEALKADAEELKNIARSDASLGTKAGAAVKAIKDAGAKDPEPAAGGTASAEGAQPASVAPAPPAAAAPAPPAAGEPAPPAAAPGHAEPPAGAPGEAAPPATQP